MKLREAIAPLTAAAILAGCGSGSPNSAPVTHPAKQRPSGPLATPPVSKWTMDMEKSLNTYRNNVLYKHQARIALGMCVAWPTTSSNGEVATNVTLNPGVAESENEQFYVFSTHIAKYDPTWGPLNGPDFLSPDATVILMTDSEIIDAKTERRLVPGEMRDVGGHQYFKDAVTKEPVLDTVLVQGNLPIGAIKRVCIELSKHERLIQTNTA